MLVFVGGLSWRSGACSLQPKSPIAFHFISFHAGRSDSIACLTLFHPVGLRQQSSFEQREQKFSLWTCRAGNAEADPDLADAIKNQLVFFHSADVTDEISVKSYNDEALELFGRADVVILAAGVCHDICDWVDVSEKTDDLQMNVNVRGGNLASLSLYFLLMCSLTILTCRKLQFGLQLSMEQGLC